MKAKQFKEVNAVYGENQPKYYPLPAYKSEDGTAVFCFEPAITANMRNRE